MTMVNFFNCTALLTLSSLAFAQDVEYGHMDGGWYMMHYGGFIMWILLIIGTVLIIFLAVQLSKNKDNEQKSKENALDILKKRYARGEITKEEYEQIKRDLTD